MKLNGKNISIESGDTILDIANRAGLSIPTLCHLRGEKPFASCMVCVVEDVATNKLHPACSTLAQPDMDIRTDTESVVEQRLCAIEFLLSEHLGDCEGPCRLSCPAYLDVPKIIRLAGFGDLDSAGAILRDALAFPRIVSRLCEAPCEKGCRRGRRDASVSIKMIERFVADEEFKSNNSNSSSENGGEAREPLSIAIIGGGPAGLACAYHLTRLGFACEVFEGKPQCWGGLSNIPESILPANLLDEELEVLENAGTLIHTNHLVATDDEKAFCELRGKHSAVVVATGSFSAGDNGEVPTIFALQTTEQGVLADSASFATSREGVFAVGDAVMPLRKMIQAVADAKILSERISEKLLGIEHIRASETFNSRFGKLLPGDLDEFMKIANETVRTAFSESQNEISERDVSLEASRCLRCDCVASHDCRLRNIADEFGAKQANRASRRRNDRRNFTRVFDGNIIFEPGKCVKCGRCSAICARFAEKNGPALTKRGYDTEIAFAFGIGPSEGLGAAAEECAKACPTGAISKIAVRDD